MSQSSDRFFMDSLALAPHFGDIAKKIQAEAWTHVCCPTGSGKSLGIAYVLANAANKPRVIVSVPTILAAQSLHSTFSSWCRSVSCGYSAEGKVFYDATTRVVYATSGHVLNLVLRAYENRDWTFCDVLCLDEVHCQSTDNHLMLQLWLRAASMSLKGSRRPRIVTMSADYDGSLFASSFPSGIKPSCYIADVKSYPIDVVYANADVAHGEMYSAVTNLVGEILRDGTRPGHILCFAQGVEAVYKLAHSLVHEPSVVSSRASVMVAYSGIEPAELDRIYAREPYGRRKIIVATNVAETSITIEGVGIVIDTLLEKLPTETEGGTMSLVTGAVSKASANQRRGRTGRSMAGWCFRMCTEASFERLAQQRVPEIERMPIDRPVLQLLCAGADPYDVLAGASDKRIASSLSLLSSLELIDRQQQPTARGRMCARLPLSVRCATVLCAWKDLPSKPPLLPAIAAMSFIDRYDGPYFCPAPSLLPPSLSTSSSDVELFMRLYLLVAQEQTTNGVTYLPPSAIGGSHASSLYRARRVASAMSSIERLACHFALGTQDIAPFNTTTAMAILLPLLESAFADRRMSLAPCTDKASTDQSPSFSLTGEQKTPFVLCPRSLLSTRRRWATGIDVLAVCSLRHNSRNLITVGCCSSTPVPPPPARFDRRDASRQSQPTFVAGFPHAKRTNPFERRVATPRQQHQQQQQVPSGGLPPKPAHRKILVAPVPLPDDAIIVVKPTEPKITLGLAFDSVDMMPTSSTWRFGSTAE